jgi:3,4-dihydroxy 2-butanone 4-phosphate synthase/GTP cyclohydrolase II
MLRLTGGVEALAVIPAEDPTPAAVALVIGDVRAVTAPLARIHSRCLYGEVFGSAECDCGAQIKAAFALIKKERVGVIIYLDQEGRGCGLTAKAAGYELHDREGLDTVEAYKRLGLPVDARSYGSAVSMLKHLGIERLRLLTNNPAKVSFLADAGFLVERVPLRVRPTIANRDYLWTKQQKLGHDLGVPTRL